MTAAQAIVACRELGAQWTAHFLAEKHRLGLVGSPPLQPMTPAPATAEAVGIIAKAAARELLARDEEVRIAGERSEPDWWDQWRSELQDLDQDLTIALSKGDMRGTVNSFSPI